MNREEEIVEATELLLRFPFNPKLKSAADLHGPAKLRAVEDPNLRALLAGAWVRNNGAWANQEARAEATARDAVYDIPDFSVPAEGPARDRWDRLNLQLLLEWTTLDERLRETEAKRIRDGRGQFTGDHVSDVRHRFRQHLRKVYGQAEVDSTWSNWDRARMEEARAKGRTGRQHFPGGIDR